MSASPGVSKIKYWKPPFASSPWPNIPPFAISTR
jgi:hypothetical protein